MKKHTFTKVLQLSLSIMLSVITILLVIDISKGADSGNEITKVLLIVCLFLFSFLFGLTILLFFWTKYNTTNAVMGSLNSIESTQEEYFNVGSIIYNSEGKIAFISPWLLKEGMNKFLGADIEKININIDDNKLQNWDFEDRVWEVMSIKEDKALLLKDISYSSFLKDIINKAELCTMSLHISYSKKINFNDSWKSEATLKIEQTLQEWANKVYGSFYHLKLTDNTFSIYFRWEEGEKDIREEIFFNELKSSISKFENDITISIGVAFGKESILEIKEKSLKMLEVSKNRGGDQIVLENSSGKIEYLGNSSIQTQSNNSQALRIFYTNLVEDVKNSKEIFITSHKIADLDSLGSCLGMHEIINKIGKNSYIVLNEFGNTAQDLFNTLPKNLKDKFITEIEANKILTNRSRLIMIDTSVPSSTQASSLVRKLQAEKIMVIDHHRVGSQTYKSLNERSLIDTSSSSASELIVRMMSLFLNKDELSNIDPNISTSLLAGIKLDTKGLTKNTTGTTHNSVLFLLNNDADTDVVNNLFMLPLNLLPIREDAFKNLKIIKTKYLFTVISKKTVIDDEIISILADDFLRYKKIEASFVLAKTDDKYKLSIRTKGKLNAQLIAESLGGGGHFNSAAVSWPTTLEYDNIIKKIIKQINGELK